MAGAGPRAATALALAFASTFALSPGEGGINVLVLIDALLSEILPQFDRGSERPEVVVVELGAHVELLPGLTALALGAGGVAGCCLGGRASSNCWWQHRVAWQPPWGKAGIRTYVHHSVR